MRWLPAIGAALGLGCAEPIPRDAASLVSMDAWRDGDASDPWFDHRPDDAACPAAARLVEGSSFEVDSGRCTFLSVEQPLAEDLRAGESVEIAFFHDVLVAEAPAQAHLGIAIGGVPVWERELAVPAEPCAFTDVVSAPAEAEFGAPIVFHLHNHGANSWNLLRIRRAEPGTLAQWAPGCE